MELTEKLLQLKDYTGDDEVVTSVDIKHEIAKLPDPVKFDAKIFGLDKVIDGFEGGELIAISGPRKSGKTLLAQTFTENFFHQDITCLWFSFELTPRQFINRFPQLPVFVMPRKLKAYALDWLQDRIIEAVAKYSVSAVFIDHLHFLFDMAKSRNASIEIGTIIRFLKTLAIELNIVIFVMCHTKKLDPLKNDISDDDIRDSSFVAQESDCGMIIWRVKDADTKARLKVCYHRRTGCWEKTINLEKKDGLLYEVWN